MIFSAPSDLYTIDFPPEEIPILQNQDTIVTTRVAEDCKKFLQGCLVIVPWKNEHGGCILYLVEKREVFRDIQDHPFFAELTDEQVACIGSYPIYSVLILTKMKMDDEQVNAIENFGITNNLGQMEDECHSKQPSQLLC